MTTQLDSADQKSKMNSVKFLQATLSILLTIGFSHSFAGISRDSSGRISLSPNTPSQSTDSPSDSESSIPLPTQKAEPAAVPAPASPTGQPVVKKAVPVKKPSAYSKKKSKTKKASASSASKKKKPASKKKKTVEPLTLPKKPEDSTPSSSALPYVLPARS